MKLFSIAGAALLASATVLAACEQGADTAAPAAEDAASPAVSEIGATADPAAPVVASASREDVADAFGCHLIVSSAMAAQMSGRDASARRYGPSLRYWHSLIEPRTQAAGLSEAEAQAVREEVVGSGFWGFNEGNAESMALLDRCFNETPADAQ